jgi:hypothetical protein
MNTLKKSLLFCAIFVGVSQLTACVVDPGRPVSYRASVYVPTPYYASPGPRWGWHEHADEGWGWYRPYGWHRGWH